MSGYFSVGMFPLEHSPIEISRSKDAIWFRTENGTQSISVHTTSVERARIRELLDEMDAEEAAKVGGAT